METKEWKLGGYVICEEDEGLLWLTYTHEKPHPGDKPFEPFIGLFTGWAYIELDTLIMSPWKVHQESEDFHIWEEVKEAFESLPQWDRTTYCVKVADIGMSGLMDCKTMKELPDDESTPIMLALGFTKIERDSDSAEASIELPF